MASLARLGDRAEAALGLAQRLLHAHAGDQAADLAADVRGDLEQPVVRADGLHREALDHGEGRAGDRDREGEAAAQPDRGRVGVAREVRVARDVDDPLRAAALEHAARAGRRRAGTTCARSASRKSSKRDRSARYQSGDGSSRSASAGRRNRRGRPASPSSGTAARRRPSARRRPTPRGSSRRPRARSGPRARESAPPEAAGTPRAGERTSETAAAPALTTAPRPARRA